MATRAVELQLKIQGAQSINDLDAVLKDINKELKSVDVNSEAFNELSAAAKQADGQLKTIKDDLRGISDEKQLDSVAKLGGALAAGFSVATVAATAFGNETEEEILKAIQVATQLNTVVSSFKPIIEGFNSANIRAFKTYASGLGDVISGFRQSAIGATLFGTATRAALTATGIGIFIVALGTIVAYWDDIAKALGFANEKQKAFFETQLEGIEKSKTALQQYNSELQFQNELLSIIGKSEAEIFANRRAIATAELANRTAYQKEIERELNLFLSIYNTQTKQFEASRLTKESFQEISAILSKTGETVEEAGKRLLKSYNDATKEVVNLKNQLALLSAQQNKFNDDEAKRLADEAKKRQDEIDKLKQKAAEFVWAKDREIDAIVEREEKELEAIGKAEAAERAAAEEEQKAFEERRARYQEMFQLMAEMNLLVIDSGDNEVEKWEKIKEKIDEITPYVDATLQGVNNITTALVDSFNTQIENVSTQLDLIDSRYQESVSTRESYEAQLATAQGERRDQLIASIDEERKKEQQLAKDRKKLENEKIKAQNRTNQIEWANSLINNAVQTALAVTKSLPNIPLAIIVGALGVASTAIIAANKPEPIPGYDKGGFTAPIGPRDASGYRVAGVVHENEYVIPERVLNTSQGSQMAATLEAMRIGMPSFAVGGYSEDALPTVTPDPNAYSLSAEAIKAAVESARIYTVATEVRDSINTVNMIEARATA